MRPLLSALAAAGILAVSVANANQCARPPEKVAFDVTGLKSQLMVVAISCQAQDRYNSFVTRYRQDLQSQEKTINAYFQRAFGRGAQKQHDEYVTLLANSQSEIGIQRGSFFCRENLGLFDQVMVLKDIKDLDGFASSKALPQPIALDDCPLAPAKVTKTAKKVSSSAGG